MGEVALTVWMTNTGPCPSCGCIVYIPTDVYNARRNDKKLFYCPNGHSLSYNETEINRVKAELEKEKKRREWAEAEAAREREAKDTARMVHAIAQGKLRAAKERVGNGVCPCCNRTFQNLMRHMHTKHPNYKKEQP